MTYFSKIEFVTNIAMVVASLAIAIHEYTRPHGMNYLVGLELMVFVLFSYDLLKQVRFLLHDRNKRKQEV